MEVWWIIFNSIDVMDRYWRCGGSLVLKWWIVGGVAVDH
jgi:hypothetical protein